MSNEKPLITVIVPVYKVEPFLDRCVDSIVKQTYDNLEIILVDDGSPDNCPAICDKWANQDNRIRVIHKENGGLSSSRNSGLDIMTGEYVSFIDSDDYIEADMIEVLYDRIKTDGSNLSLCNYLCVDDNNSTEPFEYENSLPITDEVLTSSEAQKKLFTGMHWHYVIACCKLYQADLFDDFRYPLEKLHEDLFTTHLIFEKCSLISCIRKPLYYYYQNSSSITHTYSIKRLDALDAYISRFNFFYNKKDYFCAIMSVQFMIPKLLLAKEKLDLENKETKARINGYIKQYRIMLKKVIFKRIKGVDKLELISFYFGFFTYRVYNFLRNRFLKFKG